MCGTRIIAESLALYACAVLIANDCRAATNSELPASFREPSGEGSIPTAAAEASLGATRIGLLPLSDNARVVPTLPGMAHATKHQWTMEYRKDNRRFGESISLTSDINGDGFPDLLISAPHEARKEGIRTGRVWLFLGSVNGLQTEPSWVCDSPVENGVFGRALNGIGDVNGDGLIDIVVFALRPNDPNRNDGVVYIYHGRKNLPSSEPSKTLLLNELESAFGDSLSTECDINGDGFNDLVVTAPRFSKNHHEEGMVRIYLGSPQGIRSEIAWEYYGGKLDSQCGRSLALVGDVNGDGFRDLLVGAPGRGAPSINSGRTLLFLGRTNLLEGEPAWIIDAPEGALHFGEEVAAMGDLNGDGHADFLVSAPGSGPRTLSPGHVFLYLGSSDSSAPKPNWTAHGEHPKARFGAGIAKAGDVNKDGFTDIIISSPGFGKTEKQQGRVYLFLGSATGINTFPSWIAEGKRQCQIGWAISGDRDLNGDGFSDFVVGSPYFADPEQHSFLPGRVDVFYGAPTGYQRGDQFPCDGVSSKRLFPPDSPTTQISQTVTNLPKSIAADSFVSPATPSSPFSVRTLALGLLLILGLLFLVFRKWLQRWKLTKELDVRRAVARDLHDDLGTEIARLKGAGNDSDKSRARDMALALDRALWATEPGCDSLEDLITFLGNNAEASLANTGIRCFQDLPIDCPNERLRPTLSKNILLTVKEALNNILKHSGATEVWLRVEYDKPNLSIIIEDNGRGFLPPQKLLAPGSQDAARKAEPGEDRGRMGNGLKNMRERVGEVSGSVAFTLRNGGGTRVAIVVPLDPKA
jgi:anti-sigma regulatory factor (Ser/Thr protein kinase)